MSAHALAEALERRNQRLRNVAPAKGTETSALIGESARDPLSEQRGGIEGRGLCIHDHSSRCAARTKRKILCGLLIPGCASTPLDTSTPKGCTVRMASATLSAVSPPASTSSLLCAKPRACVQSQGTPAPLTVPSKSTRLGGGSGGSLPTRTTASTASSRGRRSPARSRHSG